MAKSVYFTAKSIDFMTKSVYFVAAHAAEWQSKFNLWVGEVTLSRRK